jgi:hypothetical protein
MELSPFLCDGVVEFASQPPLSFGHLPQIRQVKFGMRTEQLIIGFGGDLAMGFFLFDGGASRFEPTFMN